MNESTIDNLFAAIPSAVPDAGVSAGARARDDSDEFGNRLRQASSPPPEPWWRASPNRSTTDQPSLAAGASTRPPLPAADRASKANKDPSLPRSDSTSDSSRLAGTDKGDRPARRDDKRSTRDDDKSSSDSSTTAVVATGVAKPAPAKTDDADKSTNNEPQGAKIETADAQKADAATAVSLPIVGSSSPTSAVGAATIGEEVPSAQQGVAASTQQPTTLPADPNAKIANTKPDASVAVAGAAKPIVQPVSAATAAAAGDPESTADATSAKKSDTKAATNSKPASKIEDQTVISPVKPLQAVQISADGAQPNAAAVDATTANDQKPSGKQDPLPANGKATADQPQPTAPIPTTSNQPVPVAAITATVAPEQTAVNNDNAAAAQKATKVAGPPNSSTLSAFGRVDRGTGSLTGSGLKQAGDGPDMPTIDPARFVSRVAKAIETAQDRGGPLSLRLSPPELGSMRIQLDVKQGVMTAKVETDTAVARQALLDNLPTLRDRLAEHNVRIDRFDVDVRRDGTGDQANPGKQQQQYQQHYNQASAPRVPSATARIADGAATEPAPIERVITNTSINLVA